MCGRFSQHWPQELWQDAWPVDWRVKDFEPRYNVAPGTAVLTFIHDHEDQTLAGLMQWGIPTPKMLLINARSETVESRPTFRPLLAKSRCVVPLNGYYEWHQQTRQPYYIRPHQDDRPGWALGLYQMTPEGARLVILTRAATTELSAIHPRMPVLADRDLAEVWLDRRESRYRQVLAMMLASEPHYPLRAVSTRVNRAREQGPDLIQPIAAES